jgi:hypothetical protein
MEGYAWRLSRNIEAFFKNASAFSSKRLDVLVKTSKYSGTSSQLKAGRGAHSPTPK